MVETRDVLRKAAEDVTQGMWCRGRWFADEITADRHVGRDAPNWSISEFFDGELTVDMAASKYRCAEGSISLVTALLGGGLDDARQAIRAVETVLHDQGYSGLYAFNDSDLGEDPFAAGQQLAELFRTTAEGL